MYEYVYNKYIHMYIPVSLCLNVPIYSIVVIVIKNKLSIIKKCAYKYIEAEFLNTNTIYSISIFYYKIFVSVKPIKSHLMQSVHTLTLNMISAAAKHQLITQ